MWAFRFFYCGTDGPPRIRKMQSPNKTGQSLLSRGGGYDFTLRLRVLHHRFADLQGIGEAQLRIHRHAPCGSEFIREGDSPEKTSGPDTPLSRMNSLPQGRWCKTQELHSQTVYRDDTPSIAGCVIGIIQRVCPGLRPPRRERSTTQPRASMRWPFMRSSAGTSN